MSATFFTLSKSDLFKSGGSASSLVSIPSVDSIVSKSGIAVYNSVSVQVGETIQYFLTFDDVIKFIHFGKGVGAVNVDGTIYSTCDGDLPGLSKVGSAISALRGSPVKVSVGPIVVTAVLTSAQVTVVGDPDTMANFLFNFAVVDHQL
jgi:hypothetical protein